MGKYKCLDELAYRKAEARGEVSLRGEIDRFQKEEEKSKFKWKESSRYDVRVHRQVLTN